MSLQSCGIYVPSLAPGGGPACPRGRGKGGGADGGAWWGRDACAPARWSVAHPASPVEGRQVLAAREGERESKCWVNTTLQHEDQGGRSSLQERERERVNAGSIQRCNMKIREAGPRCKRGRERE